ncbi:MAG TPA: secretin N-terminal domain-containing protein [Acidobacteriota bacterium]|nr:secretin N-terminal domain-containing protein [Acidobacteriota bacterium]
MSLKEDVTNLRDRRRRLAAALCAFVLLAGATACASRNSPLNRADAHARVGEWDTAITYYQQVLKNDPGNRTARSKLLMAQTNSSQFHRVQAKVLADGGDLERAQLELELAVRLDRTNQAAAVELRKVSEALEAERRSRDEERTAIERAVDASMDAPQPLPELEHHAIGQMSLDYRRARIKDIYRAMGRLGGINMLFDTDVDNPNTSFFLADVTYERALEILTAAHGHFYRVMSTNTILIAEDTQQKRRQYAPQVMRTFYLSNGEAEQIASTLQTILGARQVMPTPALNAVTIRDSAEVVEVAERMIKSLDKAGGEVLLNVEIFEVNRSVMDDYGLSLQPDYSTTASVSQTDSGISFADLGGLTTQDAFLTIPSLRYQFMKQDSSFRLIAQPQLRASDGQVSSLLVGEQRPIISTTFNPTSTVGGNVVPISSTEYRDVGIVIDATPRVHHDGTVTLQLVLQVTAVQEGSGVLEQPVFTARTLTTTLRLMEGETNLLAGLLRDDERTVYTGLPILSEIPVLKQLFGSTSQAILQTDIVMSITPYIVRMADITEADLAAVYVGTEDAISGGGGGRRGGRGGSGQDEDGDPLAGEADPILVRLTPANQDTRVGQTLSVDVTTEGSGEINNVGLRVNWNPQVLRFVEATEGSLLSSDGAETTFSSSAATQGTVAIGIGRVGQVGGVMASGRLATINFRVVGEGQTPVQIISAALRDSEGRPLPVAFRAAAVEAQED